MSRRSKAIIASTENTANPGACFYFDVPPALLQNRPTAADVQHIITTQVLQGF